MAIRSAISLGLHLRNEDNCATETKRERLVRIWWSLFSLDNLLSIITGRPSAIAYMHCTVPLPMPAEEEKVISAQNKGSTGAIHDLGPAETLGLLEANSGSYFQAIVRLDVITQDILTQLHSAAVASKSPTQVKHDILQLNLRLEEWCAWVPRRLSHWDPLNTATTPFARERLLLGFQLSRSKMLLTQPCLHSLSWSQPSMVHEELSFLKQMSVKCLDAARSTVDLLPDQPQVDFLYNQCSWWCLVHLLMQAASVLLLTSSTSIPEFCDSELLSFYMNKIDFWLQDMDDQVARRARQVLRTFLDPLMDQSS